jgi:hypothetical protein
MVNVSMFLMRIGFASAAIALTGANRLLHAALAPAATPADVSSSLRFMGGILRQRSIPVKNNCGFISIAQYNIVLKGT